MKRISKLFILVIVLVLFGGVNVNADSGKFDFVVEGNQQIKPGDTVKLKVDFSYSNPEFYEIVLNYDKNAFDVVEAKRDNSLNCYSVVEKDTVDIKDGEIDFFFKGTQSPNVVGTCGITANVTLKAKEAFNGKTVVKAKTYDFYNSDWEGGKGPGTEKTVELNVEGSNNVVPNVEPTNTPVPENSNNPVVNPTVTPNADNTKDVNADIKESLNRLEKTNLYLTIGLGIALLISIVLLILYLTSGNKYKEKSE